MEVRWKNSKQYIYHKQLKSEKKLLRKQQRYEHAMDRKQLYEKLMTNPSSKLFFISSLKGIELQLLQRSVSRSVTVSVIRLKNSVNHLQVTTKIYLPQRKMNMMTPT